MLVENRTAREDVWTRASPLLGIVGIVEALLVVDFEWPLWANALVLIGAVAALTAVVAGVNVLRGRRAFALPEDVGAIELSAFVAIGGLLQLVGGQTTSAWMLWAANAGLLLVLYVWFAYGVASILGFTGRRVGEQLGTAVDLLARAIPLLLLFSVVLFVNTEMWQVFARMNGATVAATATLLVVVGSVFLAVRLPREVSRVERDIAAGPPLQRRQRINVGLVLFVTHALQIVLVALAVGVFFTAFGALVIPAEVIAAWTGTSGRQLLALNLGDIDIRVTVELLRVSAGIAALSGLYYAVAILTDSTYREEFLGELIDDLRELFTDRARYLELARQTPGRSG